MSKELAFIAQRAKPEHVQQLKVITKTPPLLPAEIHKRGNVYANTRTGMRADLGISMRSGWEANVARIFSTHGIEWEFEPTHFPFPIKKGVRGYLPDFYLPGTDEWVEVKGYLDHSGRTKMKRFKKYYPYEFSRLVIITGPSRDAIGFFEELGITHILTYAGFRKAYKESLPNWEGL
jgi:hypothetical protein